MSETPAGEWHPDPSGRHEQRYWDGAQWTDHVSDSGVTAVDPMPAAPPAVGGGAPLQPVSNGKRLGAFLLEIVLLNVTLVIGWIIWWIIVWERGQTPAKQLLHMRVLNTTTGRRASMGDMALRELVGKGVLGFVTFGISTIVGGIQILTSEQRTALWDRMASTMVIDDPDDRY